MKPSTHSPPKKRRRTASRTRVDEREVAPLWDAFRASPSRETRNRLVEAYQPLVHDVVRRFAGRLPRSVDRGDLETAANVGLIAAVEGYDPSRGVRFETYCELRTKGALLDELRTQDWLPRPWRHRLELRKRVSERLRSEASREPSDEEIAMSMGLSPEDYAAQFGTAVPTAPSGAAPGADGIEDGVAMLEVVADDHLETPEDRLTREELLRLVAQKLTEQEYRIVYLKYWEELPMREIGELTGLSESRVSKVHARLIERLRARLSAKVALD